MRSSHSNWPGDLTFQSRKPQLSHNVYKWWENSHAELSRRYAPWFFRYLRKISVGEGGYPPPACAQVNWPLHEHDTCVALKWKIVHSSDRVYDERRPVRGSNVHAAESPCELKIRLKRICRKRLFAFYCLPPCPFRYAYRFSHRLGCFQYQTDTP